MFPIYCPKRINFYLFWKYETEEFRIFCKNHMKRLQSKLIYMTLFQIKYEIGGYWFDRTAQRALTTH